MGVGKDPENESSIKSSVFERHAQTVISTLVAGLVFWVGVTMQDMQKSLAGMTVHIQNLQTEVATLRIKNGDRYTATQALTDWNRNKQELDDIRLRLRDVERKVK